RRDDQKAARELLAVRMADSIHRLPGYQHRHYGRLTGAGGELQRQAHELRIGLRVAALDVSPEFLRPCAELRRDLSEPDCCLDGFDLAAEWTNTLEFVVTPMRQQARRFGRDQPLVGVGQPAPFLDVGADLVDDRSGVVLLLLR